MIVFKMQTAYTARRPAACRWSLPVFALLALLAGSIVPAYANTFAFGGLSESCFTYPAVAMTAQNEAIQNNRYLMTHERVYHQPESTDMILLFGPVHPWLDQFGDHVSCKVTFKDPDGPGTDAQVVGQLRFVGPQGMHILGTLDSNQHAQITTELQPVAFGYNLCSTVVVE